MEIYLVCVCVLLKDEKDGWVVVDILAHLV